MVVTDLACYGFNDGEMTLTSLHPCVALDQVRETLGWEPRVADEVGETDPPTPEELRLLREELDPGRLYL
jgi:glutaconate CoA-transferase subunit B